MKVESLVFTIIAVFLGVNGNRLLVHSEDPTGTAALAPWPRAWVLSSAVIWAVTARRMGALRPF